MNASLVGGMEHGFTDDAPLFPVFERHNLTLHSIMELHDELLHCQWPGPEQIESLHTHHQCRRVGNTPSGQL